MSKYILVKYDGEKKSINQLIESRDWDIELKEPESGVLLMKVPEEIEEELYFFKNLVFDEKTNTKFSEFQSISQDEFEKAKDLNGNNYNNNDETPRITCENNESANTPLNEKKANIFDQFKETLSEENEKKFKKSSTFHSSLIGNSLQNFQMLLNKDQFKEKVFGQYKNPYDIFLSQNYIVVYLIVIIALIIMGFL